MPTSTTHFNLQKPLVNSATDESLWGGELNDDLDTIDSIVYTAQRFVTRLIATTDSATTADNKKLLKCDATAGAFTETLPASATAGDGFTIAIKKIDASANAVTVKGSGTETIDGTNTISLATQNYWVILVCDGSGWEIISQYANTTGLAPLASPTFTGIPAAPTAAVNTSTTQIATTAFANPAATISTTGSVKLPSGLIIKWGTISAGANSSAAVTFGAAFPSALYSVYLTPKYTANTALSAVAYDGESVSGFTYRNTNSAATILSSWMAIGA